MPSLTAHEHPLQKVFSSDFQFRIPEYQRAYRWGIEQATQLLSDLETSMDQDPDEPYFLGSLVLIHEGGNSYAVVDGQQRLTTLTILWSVLRDLSDPEIAAELTQRVLEPGSKLSGIEARPRLTLRSQDAGFFATHVQTPASIPHLIALTDAVAASEPQRAIRDNAKALHERLAAWPDEKRTALAMFMSQKTYLVVVSTPNEASAFRIFSVMNARGLDLTPADIFKSEVIGATTDVGHYAKIWESIEDGLGGQDFTELFRDLRTVVTGERARRELLQEFPAQVLHPHLSTHGADHFVDELLTPYADAFERTATHEYSNGPEWTTVNTWLQRLDMLDNKDWRPAALWVFVNHSDDPEFLGSFLAQLERLAAHFLLRQTYTTPRLARYLDLLAELKAGDGLDAPSLVLSDEEKESARQALHGDVYRMQSRRARYVLLRLDELLANTPGVSYQHAIISIEHVLPQNPPADSDWRTEFTDEERLNLVHKLGNLALLNRRKNSQAQNYSFDVKKSKYFSTPTGSAVFALTTQVLTHSAWTPEVIAQRQQTLTSLLVKEWDLA